MFLRYFRGMLQLSHRTADCIVIYHCVMIENVTVLVSYLELQFSMISYYTMVINNLAVLWFSVCVQGVPRFISLS